MLSEHFTGDEAQAANEIYHGRIIPDITTLREYVNKGREYSLQQIYNRCLNSEIVPEIVTISGNSGSGKSTVSGKLSQEPEVKNEPEGRVARPINVLEADFFLYLGSFNWLFLDSSQTDSIPTPKKVKSAIKQARNIETFQRNYIDPAALICAISTIKILQKKGFGGQKITLPMHYYNRKENCFSFGLEVTIPSEGRPLVVEGTLINTIITPENFEKHQDTASMFLAKTIACNKQIKKPLRCQKELEDLKSLFLDESVESSKEKVKHVVLYPPFVVNLLKILLRDKEKTSQGVSKFPLDDIVTCRDRLQFWLIELLFMEVLDRDYLLNYEEHEWGDLLTLKTPNDYIDSALNYFRNGGEESEKFLEVIRTLFAEFLSQKTQIRRLVREIIKAKKNIQMGEGTHEKLLQKKRAITKQLRQDSLKNNQRRALSAQQEQIEKMLAIALKSKKGRVKEIGDQVIKVLDSINHILNHLCQENNSSLTDTQATPPQTEPPAGNNTDGTDPAGTE